VIEVTPDGTMNWLSPPAVYVQVTVVPDWVQPAGRAVGAALAIPAGITAAAMASPAATGVAYARRRTAGQDKKAGRFTG